MLFSFNSFCHFKSPFLVTLSYQITSISGLICFSVSLRYFTKHSKCTVSVIGFSIFKNQPSKLCTSAILTKPFAKAVHDDSSSNIFAHTFTPLLYSVIKVPRILTLFLWASLIHGLGGIVTK